MAVMLGAMVCATAAAAQPVLPKAAGPGTLVGVVADSAGTPIRDATVFVAELKRSVVTRANGSFRYDSVKAGTYTISARAVGFIANAGKVTVGAEGGTVIIEMTRVSWGLPAITTKADRGGLSGVIGDTAYRALAGARVRVMGSGAGATVTDDEGAFFLPVKPGRYMVRIQREGYAQQVVSVTVPEKEGRRISAWLAPSDQRTEAMYGANLFDLEQRLIRRGPVGSKLYTHEDFEKYSISDARDAAQRFLARRLSDDECAFIDGGPREAPLWAINASEIELMEVYESARARMGATSINGMQPMIDKGNAARPTCKHIVWLRK